MTTSQKLWLGFGTLTILLVLSIAALSVRLESIDADFAAQANVALPRSVVTRELKSNVVSYALAVRTSTETDRPEFRQEAMKYAAAVDHYLAAYEQLAATRRQRELSARFAVLWRSLQDVGQAILNSNKRPLGREDSELLLEHRVRLVTFLKDEMQPESFQTQAASGEATNLGLRTAQRLSVILIIVGLLTAAVTSALVGRALVRGERRMAEQGERLRTTLASIGDAVLTTDTEGRITNINRVAETLTGWTVQEAVGQPLDAVFRIVNKETRQTAQSPVTRALREGTIVRLANHIILIAKDGTERPIDDSAAPITDKEGKVYGCVLVFRDVTQRRRVEQRRLDDESRMRSVVNHILDGIITIDENGLVDSVNPAAEKLFGYEAGEIVGRNVNMLMPEPYHSEHDGYLANYSRTGQPKIIGIGREVRGRCKDGSTFPIDLAVSEFSFNNRRYFTGIVRDITSRKHAEATLRYQYGLTKSITDNATTAIFMMDDLRRCTFMNPAAEVMTGFTLIEAKGEILHDLIHHHQPDGRPYPMRDCPIDRVLPEGTVVHGLEDVFIRKNGEFFPVRCHASPIYQEGLLTGTVMEVRDITSEKQVAQAAHQRSAQIRRLADMATRLNDLHDTQSIMGIISEEARNLIGAHQAVSSITNNEDWKQSLVTTSLSEKYAGWQGYDEKPDGSGIYSLVRRTNKPMRLTQAELEAHPAWKEFSSHAAHHPPLRGWLAVPFADLRRGNVGLIQVSDKYEGEFTADDETVLVQLAQMASVALKNAQLVEDLEEADRRKNEFLATLAHELRNPLAPVRNAVQVLHMKGTGRRPELQWARDVIDRQMKQMTRLIDDLMDVSRISRNKLELRKESVELATVVEAALETSRMLIEEHGHKLTVTLPPDPIILDADLTRLAQVFLNLLNNAAKYTDKGGRIELHAQRQGREVVVSVKDNGIGIAAERLPTIFTMFSQVAGTEFRSKGGLGIGLSLVRRVVELHGGSVEAHSDGPHKGSEFVVRLPIVLEHRDRSKMGGDSKGVTPSSPLRILVVDDNRDAALSSEMLLKMMGHSIRTAHDGEAAVCAAEEFRPHVVLLDIGLPKMNGYEVARHIRNEPWGTNVTLIAITGWGHDQDKRRSEEAGFNRHMVKPVDPHVLMKTLAELQPA